MADICTKNLVRIAAAIAICFAVAPAQAGEATIAVAANFTSAAKALGKAFEAETGQNITFSFGSTGQLFAQIRQGAPFDAFLAADRERPKRAEAEGLAVPETRFTYAVGRLALWSADPGLIDNSPSILSDAGLKHVAIANPATAPYGAAALETMKQLGVFETLEPRLVTGASVGQAFQFVATGNAPVGFVALSQVVGETSGSRWIVPESMHAPLRQDAVLLVHGRNNNAAKAFLEFLKGKEAVKILQTLGYEVPDPE